MKKQKNTLHLSDKALKVLFGMGQRVASGNIRHIQYVEPYVSNIRVNGNTIVFDVDWGRNMPEGAVDAFYPGGSQQETNRLVYDPATSEWTYTNNVFPNGRTGTKMFLQYDHEFPKNLCDAMNQLDSSKSYK